jgi:hypothetical protein
MEEKTYFLFGKLEKLQGETKCYEKYNTHEVEELENRCFPKGFIGSCEEHFERRGCGERREHNCGKRFARRETFTPATEEVVVTEDCNCG